MDLLIVIDMQNDFIHGPLGSKKALSIIDLICDTINLFKKNNDTIVYTKDMHSSNFLDTFEGKLIKINHCIKDTKGSLIHDDIKKYITSDSIIFEKNKFGSDELITFIKNNNFENIYICGLVLDICVLVNTILILNSKNNKTNIFIYKKLTISSNNKLKKYTTTLLKNLGVEFI